jgi:hypothetical protein
MRLCRGPPEASIFPLRPIAQRYRFLEIGLGTVESGVERQRILAGRFDLRCQIINLRLKGRRVEGEQTSPLCSI